MGLVLGPGLGLGLGLGLESACGPVEGREIVLPPGGSHVHLCHPALIDETLGPRDAVCGKARDYFRRMDVVGEHYPERVARVFVVNAPPWFALAWDFCAPLIPPRTKAKLAVCAGPSPPELLAVVGAAALPRCYGGENDCAFGESAEEQALEGFVEQLNGGGRAGQGGAGGGVTRCGPRFLLIHKSHAAWTTDRTVIN